MHAILSQPAPFKLMCTLLDCRRKPEHQREEKGVGVVVVGGGDEAAAARLPSRCPHTLSTNAHTDVQHRFHVEHVALIRTSVFPTPAAVQGQVLLRVCLSPIVLHPAPAWPLAHRKSKTNSPISPAALENYSNCSIVDGKTTGLEAAEQRKLRRIPPSRLRLSPQR